MTRGFRVLMLLTDGFGGTGGIAKFNRDFLQALDCCATVQRVHAFPRLVAGPVEAIPERVVYHRAVARSRLSYVLRIAAHVWRGGRAQVVICGHIYLLPVAWILSRVCRARLVLIIHGIEAWAPSRKWLVNRLAHRIDALLAVSHHSAAKFVRWSGVSLKRTQILPNCVDLRRFRPQPRDRRLLERYGLQGSKVILTVGRLASQENKGFDQIIALMPELRKQFANLKYLIVGDGDDRARLEAKAEALGVDDAVIFAGHIAEAEKVAHYNLADAYVMPSMGEGFGIVLIEAAACGVPIVGSQADGSREALLDGRLGRLIDPQNSIELRQAIAESLERSNDHYRRPDVEVFSVHNFRSRVAEWCRALENLATA